MEISQYKKLKETVPNFKLVHIGSDVFACAVCTYDPYTREKKPEHERFEVTRQQLVDLRAQWKINLDNLDEMIKDIDEATSVKPTA